MREACLKGTLHYYSISVKKDVQNFLQPFWASAKGHVTIVGHAKRNFRKSFLNPQIMIGTKI